MADVDWQSKVEALLTKARRTDNQHEAEAFMAKAQELMRRHAIDEEMLDAARGHTAEIGFTHLQIEHPYAEAKATLLTAIAWANSCRAVMVESPDGRGLLAELVGFDTDRENVMILFGSLLSYAIERLIATPVPIFEHPIAFRAGFILGFANRVGQRLAEAARLAQDEAAAASGVELVLVDRSGKVDDLMKDRYPEAGTHEVGSTSQVGVAFGHDAANGSPLGKAELE